MAKKSAASPTTREVLGGVALPFQDVKRGDARQCMLYATDAATARMSLLSNEVQRAQLTETFDALLLQSRWSRALMVPFATVFFPAYSLGCFWIIYPVYFDPPMIAEWLPQTDPTKASVMMSATSSVMFCFWMVGALFWSGRADAYGRRRSSIAAAWGTLALAALAACSWSFYSYAVLRALLGLFIGGQGACTFLLVMEWSHPRDASLLTFLGNFLFSVGLVGMAGIAAVGTEHHLSWRIQLLILVAIAATPLLFSHLILESPRWLLTAGREAEAAEIILSTSYGAPSARQDELLGRVRATLDELAGVKMGLIEYIQREIIPPLLAAPTATHI